MSFELKQVESLAPDQASLTAASKLAKPSKWLTLTHDAGLWWGEGGDTDSLLSRLAALVRSGVNVIVLLALSDQGRPSYRLADRYQGHTVTTNHQHSAITADGCVEIGAPGYVALLWAGRAVAVVRGQHGEVALSVRLIARLGLGRAVPAYQSTSPSRSRATSTVTIRPRRRLRQ